MGRVKKRYRRKKRDGVILCKRKPGDVKKKRGGGETETPEQPVGVRENVRRSMKFWIGGVTPRMRESLY